MTSISDVTPKVYSTRTVINLATVVNITCTRYLVDSLDTSKQKAGRNSTVKHSSRCNNAIVTGCPTFIVLRN